MSETLDYISHDENTKVFLESLTLFLCLPIPAPKCHRILTVTPFSHATCFLHTHPRAAKILLSPHPHANLEDCLHPYFLTSKLPSE